MSDQTNSNYQERRVQFRRPVNLAAEIRVRGRVESVCRIRNICTGGAFLEIGTGAPDLRLRPDDRCHIRFDLPDRETLVAIQGIIQVVHRLDQGLGVRFIHLSGDGKDRLLQFMRASESGVGAALLLGRPQDRMRALAVLRDVSQQRLGGLLDALLEQVVDELWTHYERAGSDSERSRLSGDIVLLARAIQDQRLPRALLDTLLEPLTRLGDPATTPTAASPTAQMAQQGLELLGQEEFETWLAKSEFCKYLDQAVGVPLTQLRARLLGLFGRTPLSIEPEGLAEALGQFLREVGVGLEVFRLFMRIAAASLAGNLGALYREILQAWTVAQLPASDVPPTAPIGQVAGQAALPRNEPPAPPAPSAAPLPPAHSPDAPSPSRDAAKPRASARRIGPAAFLKRLPTDYHLSKADSGRPFKELVAEWLNRAGTLPGTEAISPQVEERVDATDRILSHLLADPTTPQQLKSLIKRLSIHLLAMAISDPGAMAEGRHPLVGLMNQMEHLSLFLLNGTADDPALHQEFESLVRQVVATDARDTRALSRLSQRLRAVESRVGGDYQTNVKRWLDVCESRERERQARILVRDRLNTVLAGRQVHALVFDLLESGWRTLLESACTYGPIDGPRWQRYWKPLWSLHLATGGEGQPGDAPVGDPASLLQDLRAGLGATGLDPFNGNELLQRIEASLHRARGSGVQAGDYHTFATLPPERDEVPERAPAGLTPSGWEEGVRQVDALPLGTLIWMWDKEVSRAYRLVWRSDDGTRLALSDPLGKRMQFIRRGRLVESLASGLSRVQAPAEQRLMTRAADASLTEMQERIQYQETHDELTGLANQRRLVAALTQLLRLAPDTLSMHALCFMDLDHFDAVTGSYGYSTGERILVAVARLLEQSLRDAACLAYLGASRFGWLTPVGDRRHAAEMAEGVRRDLTRMPLHAQGKPFRVSGSLGLALVVDGTANPEGLLSAASVACLAAQRSGGDRVVLFSEEDEAIARQLTQMRNWAQAEAILEGGRRRLRCQKIAPIDGGGVELAHHYEILLSVYDEQGAPLPLASFIAAAEAFNLMPEVDRQVIRSTIQWIQTHRRDVDETAGFAINLSGQSLTDPGLPAYVRETLERSGVPPRLVGFEVTETTAIVNLERAVSILEEIKGLGCSISLDDFGSGMSSYGYLKTLPVDYVKIDGAFVRHLATNPNDRAIVKSFNEIAHFMGKRTIAEYVENQEILEMLREIGVDYGQGYAIERPRFIDELPALH